MTTVDIIVLAPIVPVLPLLVTWWLPWERWIPWAKVPPLLLGPYVLYGAFVGWYFHLHTWVIILLVLVGIIVSLIGLAALRRKHETFEP